MTPGAPPARTSLAWRPLQHSLWDSLPVALSIALGVTLARHASMPVIAVAVWWNANTIAHNFIHRPFFRSRVWNGVYSLYLSALLGFPQSWWRDRHLAHHAGRPVRLRLNAQAITEAILVLSLWTVLAARADFFFWTTYLPGWALGLGLCWMHGRFEHPGGTTVSHYGAVYNLLFFNDGYHVEHHRSPGAHWTELPLQPVDSPGGSRWPAVLRWLEGAHCPVINRLERLSLRSARLQSFLLRTHGAALSRLFPLLAGARSIRIVGGGLFPRSAILLRRLLPDAAITIMDASAHNIAAARPFVPGGVEFEARKYDGAPDGADLVVIPLSFRGNRRALYENPPARALLIHDWIWEARGEGAVVSWLLLKRVNLVQRIRP